MLIRRKSNNSSLDSFSKSPERSEVQSDLKRLECLLVALERNISLEGYFLARREVEYLLEILPGQRDILKALTDLAENLDLSAAEADNLNKRLACAALKRARNRNLLDDLIKSAKSELDDLNAARVKLQQMRSLSKTIYAEPEPFRLEDWA